MSFYYNIPKTPSACLNVNVTIHSALDADYFVFVIKTLKISTFCVRFRGT